MKIDARVVLSESNFADLVEGREVTIGGALDVLGHVQVRIILADIGFPAMLHAISIAAMNARGKKDGV